MTPPVFLVDRDDLHPAARVILDGAEGRHAATVRRIVAGEIVDLTDGAGRTARCKVVRAGSDRLEVDVLALRDMPRPQPRIVVVQALPKSDRGELAVQTMTEVGVDVIVPWAAARCITRWRPERADRSLARWRAAARESAKQARRAWLPEVTELATTAQVVARVAAAGAAVVFHEEATVAIGDINLPETGEVVLVVGPEGGLTSAEVAGFSAAGAICTRLGPTVLRTSTAGAIGAAALLSRTPRWARANPSS